MLPGIGVCAFPIQDADCMRNGVYYGFAATETSFSCGASQVAAVTAKVALRTATGVDVETSDFLKAVRDGFVDELIEHCLDEDALVRVRSGQESAGADVENAMHASYEELKKFMNKEEDKRAKIAGGGDGYINFREKMQRVDDGKGGMVWVRTENVQKWRDSLLTRAPSK